jgi:hypothetical protein
METQMGRTRTEHGMRGRTASACLLFFALLLAAPMLLGPALAPVLRVLRVEAVHLCACGMPAGKCGCPECERIERQQQGYPSPCREPVLTASCQNDGAAVSAGSGFLYVLPAGCSLRQQERGAVLAQRRLAGWLGFEGEGPPTPPPKNRLS